MIDENLKIARNELPVFVPGPSFSPYLFGGLATPNYIDMLAVMDWARAKPVFANFRVATAFDNVADNRLRMAIYTSRTVDFLDIVLDPTNPIARSYDFSPAGLATVGQWSHVAMPPLSDLARLLAEGRRYVAIGLEGLIPSTNFVAGGLDVVVTHEPIPTMPTVHRAAF